MNASDPATPARSLFFELLARHNGFGLWSRGHPSGNGAAVEQPSAELPDGEGHQLGDAPIGELGGRAVSRLIVVSNRVSVPDPEGPRQAGGLAVAVNAALKRRDGVWFGWSGKTVEDEGPIEPRIIHQRKRTVITLDLSATDFQEYYNGFANRVLWPILHYRVDLAEFTSLELGGYLRVNALFADALSRFNNRSFQKVDMTIQELELTMLSTMLASLRIA